MTARLILKFPDKRLRGNSDSVTDDEYETSVPRWCQDLRDTMVANAGLGLAGPQIGIKKKIFAVDVKDLDNPGALLQESKDGALYIINPVLSLAEKETHGSVEACLSVPGVMYKVKRSPVINLSYTTPQKESISVRITGEDAAVIQHEYDHLVGKLFIDRLNPFDKKQFAKLHQVPKKEKSEEEINQLREQRRAKARAKRKK